MNGTIVQNDLPLWEVRRILAPCRRGIGPNDWRIISHTTSNLVIFATKKGRHEEAKIDHGSGTLVAFRIATTFGGGGVATGDDFQYTL